MTMAALHCGRYVSLYGEVEMVERFIASGRDLGDVKNKKGKDWNGDQEYTVLEAARQREETGLASLLERFIDNSAQTRHEVRVKLGSVG